MATFMGDPIIRIIVYWGLYWVSLILGNYHICTPISHVVTNLSPPLTFYWGPLALQVADSRRLTERAQNGPMHPLVGSTPQLKSIDFLGIHCYNKNPEAKKVLKCSTPILGSRLRHAKLPTMFAAFTFCSFTTR